MIAAFTVAAVPLLTACSSGSATAGSSTPPATPSTSTPAASSLVQTYPDIGAARAKKLERQIPTMGGVQNDTYYPDAKKFQVYFRATATPAQKQAVKRRVLGG